MKEGEDASIALDCTFAVSDLVPETLFPTRAPCILSITKSKQPPLDKILDGHLGYFSIKTAEKKDLFVLAHVKGFASFKSSTPNFDKVCILSLIIRLFSILLFLVY